MSRAPGDDRAPRAPDPPVFGYIAAATGIGFGLGGFVMAGRADIGGLQLVFGFALLSWIISIPCLILLYRQFKHAYRDLHWHNGVQRDHGHLRSVWLWYNISLLLSSLITLVAGGIVLYQGSLGRGLERPTGATVLLALQVVPFSFTCLNFWVFQKHSVNPAVPSTHQSGATRAAVRRRLPFGRRGNALVEPTELTDNPQHRHPQPEPAHLRSLGHAHSRDSFSEAESDISGSDSGEEPLHLPRHKERRKARR